MSCPCGPLTSTVASSEITYDVFDSSFLISSFSFLILSLSS